VQNAGIKPVTDHEPFSVMTCPQPDELLRYAAGQPVTEAASSHVRSCAQCLERVRWLRDAMSDVHNTGVPRTPHASPDTIAAIADGEYPRVAREEFLHVSACSDCLSKVAMIVETLNDPAVAAELDALHSHESPNRSSRAAVRLLGGLAAAAVAAIVLLQPAASRVAAYRESGITTTEPPGILSPRNGTRATDSIRWTAVPNADIYQVRIWSTEGSIVWSTETKNVAVAMPATLSPGVQYLWEVKARTGWDRWVESELVPFFIPAH
jgi:hypothetical protein